MSAPKGKVKQQTLVKTSTEVDIALPPVKDFIPGKISLKEWETLLEIEEGVDTVCEIVEEIVENASDVIYKKYLAEAAFGYAVQDAKEKMLNIIALEFVGRDEGEGDTDVDPTWMEECEPLPPPIDSWSCGMVPMAITESLCEPVDCLCPVSIVQLDIPRSAEFRHTDNKTDSNRGLPPRSSTKSTPSESSRAAKRKPKRFRRPGAGVHRMVAIDQPQSDKEEEEEDLVDEGEKDLGQDTHGSEVSASSPVPDMSTVSHTPFGMKPVQLKWMKEVKYDDKGRIIEMVKLDPTKFPSHRTKPVVSITKPQVPAYRRKRCNKLKPLSPRKAALLPKPHPPEVAVPHSNTVNVGASGADTFYVKNHTPKSKVEPVIKVKISDIRSSLGKDFADGKPLVGSSREGRRVTVMPSGKGLTPEVTARRFPEVPAIPSLVDSIDPLPGVTVREGGRSVHGPTPISQPPVTPLEGLRPIRTPPEIIIGKEEEAQSVVATNSHSVAFALPESSPSYQNRIPPARILS